MLNLEQMEPEQNGWLLNDFGLFHYFNMTLVRKFSQINFAASPSPMAITFSYYNEWGCIACNSVIILCYFCYTWGDTEQILWIHFKIRVGNKCDLCDPLEGRIYFLSQLANYLVFTRHVHWYARSRSC